MSTHQSPEVCAALAIALAAIFRNDLTHTNYAPAVHQLEAGVSEVLAATETLEPTRNNPGNIDTEIRYRDRNGQERTHYLNGCTIKYLLREAAVTVPDHTLTWTVTE